jgi:hypothetical protein
MFQTFWLMEVSGESLPEIFLNTIIVFNSVEAYFKN